MQADHDRDSRPSPAATRPRVFAAPAPRRFDGPLLDPRAEDLRHAGRIVGQVVTLGERVQLFSTLPGLAGLDGRVFADLERLRAAVRELLSGPAPGPLAQSPAASEIRAMPGVSVTMRRALRSSK